MTAAAFWWVNTVTVQPYQGTRNGTPSYGATRTVACWVENETRLVRNDAGLETVSSTCIYAALADAAAFPVGSTVTVDGRQSTVISANRHDSGSLALGVDHVQVDLT